MELLTSYTVRALILVRAEDAPAANQIAATFDPEGGLHTFQPNLSPTGHAPATHCLASLQMQQGTYEGAAGAVASFPGGLVLAYDLAADPGFVDRMLPRWGLQRVDLRELL